MGLALVSTITATVVLAPRPVGAAQISNLQAQAAQISQELVREQLQINSVEQQYAVDVVRVQRDEQAIQATQRQLLEANRKIERDRYRLRQEALTVYTTAGSADPGGTLALFNGNERTAASIAEYQQVASGDINTTLAVLHTDEVQLRAEETTLQQQRSADQAVTDQEAVLDQRAGEIQVQLESKQSEVSGELAAAVAQQQAAQAVAAAAAVRAAQQAAGNTPGAGADPVLNAFLRCVVQAESNGNYGAVSPGGQYMGAFQFSQATWNEAAQLAGMPQLIGVPPNQATPAQQDALAIALYNADGQQPWYDPCRTS